MPTSFHPARGLLAATGLAASLLLALPAHARDAASMPVSVAAGEGREWLLQATPGSGAVAGAARRDLAAQASNPKTRTWPGYAAPVPGIQPSYAAPARGYGYPTAPPKRAAIVSADRAAEPKRTVATGIFAAFRRPAAAPQQPHRTTAPAAGLDPVFLPQDVAYAGREAPGTIVIDTNERFLFLVGRNGTARRYGVGVGKPGFEWAGRHRVTRKSEWPTWTPPSQMRARERAKGRILPVSMAGGPENPLGARAMYLGSTLYRIHGTNQPWTIGRAVSSGCIRMRNEDVSDLYERVSVGTSVIVL